MAVISSEGTGDCAYAGANGGRLTARVSPNGRYLAFMSSGNLTGYDPADPVTGHADEQVYLYDAQT